MRKKNLPHFARFIAQKLTRWDAIYFVTISKRGYVFEQEWAFGWGMNKSIAIGVLGLKKFFDFDGLESIVGIFIAHINHFLSVIILFILTMKMFPGEKEVAFCSACLHILSPAGIFLSAPYAESPCASLSFAGIFLFAKSFSVGADLTKDILILISGVLFGITTTFRSNGILNGFLLLEEAIRTFWDLINNRTQINKIRHLVVTGIAGLFVASGFLIPQYIAYGEYCAERLDVKRPWCARVFPSIYQFVQNHYWNVGLFRYWKISNLPLFIISAPLYCLIFASGIWAVNLTAKSIKSSENIGGLKINAPYRWILRNLAFSQLILAIGTFTTAHVQIISRTSSSYPVWIWFLTVLLLGRVRTQYKSLVKGLTSYLITYGIVQAGLYGSFLPPA